MVPTAGISRWLKVPHDKQQTALDLQSLIAPPNTGILEILPQIFVEQRQSKQIEDDALTCLYCSIDKYLILTKMARSLAKVQKRVSKKRGGKLNTLHENSRDSKRLRRAGAREDKIARLLQAAKSANQLYGRFPPL